MQVYSRKPQHFISKVDLKIRWFPFTSEGERKVSCKKTQHSDFGQASKDARGGRNLGHHEVISPPRNNDKVLWIAFLYNSFLKTEQLTSAMDISLRRPAPDVSVMSTCCKKNTKNKWRQCVTAKKMHIFPGKCGVNYFWREIVRQSMERGRY